MPGLSSFSAGLPTSFEMPCAFRRTSSSGSGSVWPVSGRPHRVPILSPSAVVPTPGGGAAPCAPGEVFPFRSCSNGSLSLASTSFVAGSEWGFVCWAFGFAFRGGLLVELFRGGFPAGFVLVRGQPPALLGPGNGNVNSKVRPTARRGGVRMVTAITANDISGSSPRGRGARGAGASSRLLPLQAGAAAGVG